MATRLLSADTATAHTGILDEYSCTKVPDARLQIQAFRAKLPATTNLSSGVRATASTWPDAPGNRRRSTPESRSHSRTLPSALAEMICLPFFV